MPDQPTRGRLLDGAIALAFAAAFWFMASRDLARFQEPLFDEIYTFPSVGQILAGLAPTEQTHPPLSKLLMALGAWLARGTVAPEDLLAYGARLLSPAAGALALVGLYALVRGMADRRAAAIATCLLACDGVFVLFSRLALTNIYGLAFTTLGLAATWRAYDRRQPGWLYPAGVAFGLGVASRWTSGLSLVAAGLWLAAVIALDERKRLGAWAAHAVAALVALPVATYVASYAQTVAANPAFGWAGVATPAGVAQVVTLNRFALGTHVGALVHHPCESAWWTWPLALRPAWFYFSYNGDTREVLGVIDLGNVFIWWLALPAIGFALYRAWRGDRAMALLATLALATWLPWALVASKQLFIHYFFESIPPVCAILGIGLARRWAHGHGGRAIALAYVALVATWLVYFSPLIWGRPIAMSAYAAHMWLGPQNWDMASITGQYMAKYHLRDMDALDQQLGKNYPNLKAMGKAQDDATKPPPAPSW